MQKLAHILLILLTLYATSGIGVRAHYCHGNLLANHLLVIPDEAGSCHSDRETGNCCVSKCKADTPLGHDHVHADDENCCSDVLSYNKLWDQYLSVSDQQLNPPLLSPPASYDFRLPTAIKHIVEPEQLSPLLQIQLALLQVYKI